MHIHQKEQNTPTQPHGCPDGIYAMTTLYNKYFNYLKWNYFISSDAQIKIDYGSQRVIYG